jgi:hypothetical protein
VNDELGRWLIFFDDGSGLEFSSLAAMQEAVKEVETLDNTRKLFIGWWLARSADGSNTAPIVNKTMTFDLSNPNAIKVQ